MIARAAMGRLTLACWLLALQGFRQAQASTAADVKRILTEVVNVNDAHVRPALDQSSPVEVKFDAHPIAFSDFDEVAQKLSGTMWLFVTWKDELLTWNPWLYNNTFMVYPDPKYLWRPNIALVNTYSELAPVGGDFTLIQLMYNGTVMWYPGFTFDVFCKMNIHKYPFDTQRCYFDFFVWGLTALEVPLSTITNGFVLDSYLTNGEWEFSNSWVEHKNISTVEVVSIYVNLRRMPSFIVISVLLPVFFLSIMNIMVFAIPMESGEKVSYAITVLLSLAVFLSFISNMMPQTSESISALSVLIAMQLGLSSLYIVITILVMRVHQRSADEPVTGYFAAITRLGLCIRENKVHDIIIVKEKEQPIEVSKAMTFDPERLTWHMVGRAIDNICFFVFSGLILLVVVIYMVLMVLL